MITNVCKFFGVFPRSTPTYIPSCQLTYFSVQCLRYFKSNFVFTSNLCEFQSSNGCCHFCRCNTSSFPKSIVSHVSVGVALIGFNKSSKCSLHRQRISFSFLRMFPVESLMENVKLSFSHASGE